MKAKSLFLSALAASMTLVACNKNETQAVPETDNTPKSVSINLANVVPGIKGAAEAVTGGKVTLTDFQVFFTDGTNLIKGKTADGADADHYFANLAEFDADSRDKVFHLLPAKVNKVIVVGNYGSEITETAYAKLERELTIASQQNPDDLDLYQEVELTSVVGDDAFGHPLYKADVVLEPRVARIEIGRFEYAESAEGARMYKSIEVQQVMLNNYYATAQLQGNTVADLETEPTGEGAIFATFEKGATPTGDGQSNWFSDVFTPDAVPTEKLPLVTLDADATTPEASYVHEYTGEGTLRPAYHFFPNNDNIGGTSHPQVLVKMIGIDEDDNQVPLYIVVDKFNPAVTTDIAKIYVMDLQFSDDNLGNPQKCVEVSVDVKNWEVVPVTPEF